MTLRVEEEFGKSIPASFFNQPTLENLADLLREKKAEGEESTQAASAPFPGKVSKKKYARLLQEAGRFKRINGLYNRWLKTVCGMKWFQRFSQPRQTSLAQAFHQIFDTGMQEADFVQMVLFSNVWRLQTMRWLTRNLPVDILFGMVKLEGMENLLHARQRGRGVLLLCHHSTLLRLVPALMEKLEMQDWYSVRREGLHRTLHEEDQARELTQKLVKAREVLKRGGVVSIAGDGLQGTSQRVQVAFHGRMLSFLSGFIELGLRSGASMVPVMMGFNPDGTVVINFQPPLQVTDQENSQGVDDALLKQYAERLAQHWKAYPWSVLPVRMRDYLRAPAVGDAPRE